MYHLQVLQGDIELLRKKYSAEKIDSYCDWSEESTYLACFKKDFYKFIRETGPYENQLALELEQDLYDMSEGRHKLPEGKISLFLDHLDLLNNFMIINKKMVVSRKSLHVAGPILTFLLRDRVLSYFHELEQQIEVINSKYAFILLQNQDLANRFNFLVKEYHTLKASVRVSGKE